MSDATGSSTYILDPFGELNSGNQRREPDHWIWPQR